MGKKVGGKKRSAPADDRVEMLDMDVPDAVLTSDDEDHVVHNRRTRDNIDGLAVLPGDAHRLDTEEATYAEAMEEEKALAVATARRRKSGLSASDFAIPGVATEVVEDEEAMPDMAAVEAVERDFESLTADQRLEMVARDSPEALALVAEFRKHIADVRAMTEPLTELLAAKRKKSDRELIAFLETKYQLLLSYCIHVCFYLLLKVEGAKVAGHPVIDRLVEIRVYLEKMWPVEQRLSYALNKLLSGATDDDAAAPNVTALRATGQDSAVNKTRVVDEEARAARKQRRAAEMATSLEAEEQRAFTRVRGKHAKAAADVAPLSELSGAAPTAEDEDQFLSKFMDSDSDDDADVSLIDKLRKKKAATTAQRESRKAAKAAAAEEEEEEVVGDEDEDEDGALDYDDLLGEQSKRDAAAAAKTVGDSYIEPTVGRRHITTTIEKHRGLTKSRPKDRKNPRVNRRVKAKKGEREAAAQTRSVKPESAKGFGGVVGLKTHVTHSNKLV